MTKESNPIKLNILEELKINRSDFAAITNFPSPIKGTYDHLSNDEKIDIIASKFRDIMEVLGLDLDDDSLQKTPYRVAKMYVQEIFSGLDIANFPSPTFFEDKFKKGTESSIVFVKVSFISFCEHHFVPIVGTASVAYRPNGKIIGLSKIPRIVRFFARRPQVQERLTAQIADSLSLLLETDDVAVSLSAQHYCIIARGVEDENSHTITNVLRGEFEKNENLRSEFFEALNRPALKNP